MTWILFSYLAIGILYAVLVWQKHDGSGPLPWRVFAATTLVLVWLPIAIYAVGVAVREAWRGEP